MLIIFTFTKGHVWSACFSIITQTYNMEATGTWINVRASHKELCQLHQFYLHSGPQDCKLWQSQKSVLGSLHYFFINLDFYCLFEKNVFLHKQWKWRKNIPGVHVNLICFWVAKWTWHYFDTPPTCTKTMEECRIFSDLKSYMFPCYSNWKKFHADQFDIKKLTFVGFQKISPQINSNSVMIRSQMLTAACAIVDLWPTEWQAPISIMIMSSNQLSLSFASSFTSAAPCWMQTALPTLQW